MQKFYFLAFLRRAPQIKILCGLRGGKIHYFAELQFAKPTHFPIYSACKTHIKNSRARFFATAARPLGYRIHSRQLPPLPARKILSIVALTFLGGEFLIKQMKSIAAIHRTYGNPAEVVHPETIEIPEPKKGEAVVKLVKAVVNPSDLGMIGGSYGRLRQLPAIAGREGVGEVVALGPDTESPRIGTLVRLPSEPGAWTQYQIANADDLLQIPAGIDTDAAAMAFINPPTALCVLSEFENVKKGDWLIQNGAGSALGIFMIQICAARGIKTVNMLRNAEKKRSMLEGYGADIVVDEAEFNPKVIKEATAGQIKLGLNQIGGNSVSNIIKAVGDSATVVTIGGMTGEPIRFPTRFLIFNDLRLRGFWWDKWQRTHSREECDALFSEVFGLIADGTLKAPVDSRFKMEDIEAAMKRATENSRLGKVMLEF